MWEVLWKAFFIVAIELLWLQHDSIMAVEGFGMELPGTRWQSDIPKRPASIFANRINRKVTTMRIQ